MIINMFHRLRLRDEEGQALVEYALGDERELNERASAFFISKIGPHRDGTWELNRPR